MYYRCFNRIRNNSGFTLIEIIVSLIVASILGVMLVSFMGSTVVQSANPVLLAQNGAYLNEIMENMTSDYKYRMFLSPTTGLTNFSTNIGNEGDSKSNYADSSHPYTVVDNHRISFPSGSNVNATDPDPSGKILKVTIQYGGLSVTALFSE